MFKKFNITNSNNQIEQYDTVNIIKIQQKIDNVIANNPIILQNNSAIKSLKLDLYALFIFRNNNNNKSDHIIIISFIGDINNLIILVNIIVFAINK
jgi:hypothetical protein